MDDSPPFNYTDDLEPLPAGYEPARQDAVRAVGKDYARYLKPLRPGQLYVKARGKEIVFAAGLVSTCHVYCLYVIDQLVRSFL